MHSVSGGFGAGAYQMAEPEDEQAYNSRRIK